MDISYTDNSTDDIDFNNTINDSDDPEEQTDDIYVKSNVKHWKCRLCTQHLYDKYKEAHDKSKHHMKQLEYLKGCKSIAEAKQKQNKRRMTIYNKMKNQ
jgi:hypothetical protein